VRCPRRGAGPTAPPRGGSSPRPADRPRAVVAASPAEDVATTVAFARTHGLDVAVRATGHGAVAEDLGRTILVHTGCLDSIEIDGGLRRASATENPALYWALRGGKGAHRG
jgi:FAD/FMN-containing dehydrogenase